MPRQRIPDFRCQLCPSIYLSQTGLDGHIEKEHGSQNETSPNAQTPSLPKYVPRNRSSTFNCTMCNYKYLEQSGLDKHMEKDHNVTPGSGADITSPMTMVMNRPANGQTSNTSTAYTPRRRTQDFKCLYCTPESPSIYLTETGLAKHVEKEHSNPQDESANQDWKPVDITEIFQRSSNNIGDVKSPGKAVTVKEAVKTGSKVEVKGTKRKAKKEKDPNAPKRPLTGYFLFMGDERANIKAANPQFTVGDISKELGQRWNSLEAGLKQNYLEKSAKDRARYETEMKEYQT